MTFHRDFFYHVFFRHDIGYADGIGGARQSRELFRHRPAGELRYVDGSFFNAAQAQYGLDIGVDKILVIKPAFFCLAGLDYYFGFHVDVAFDGYLGRFPWTLARGGLVSGSLEIPVETAIPPPVGGTGGLGMVPVDAAGGNTGVCA